MHVGVGAGCWDVCQGACNEYPQHMFLWRNKKTISTFWLKKHLIWSYGKYPKISNTSV